MIRALDDLLLLVLLPSALFAVYLLLTRKPVLRLEHWRGPAPWLLLSGIVLCIVVMLFAGFTAPRSTHAYDPPHMENGVLVPGRFK